MIGSQGHVGAVSQGAMAPPSPMADAGPAAATGSGLLARVRRGLGVLTDPRYRRLHAVVIATALVLHLALHYATYLPALRGFLGHLPYFRLHVLHEAEFLAIVAYAGVTFRWKGGLAAIAITAVTSVPFILSPYIFGREPRQDEIRDMSIQVALILLMGLLIVAVYVADARRRHLQSVAEGLRQADQVKSTFISIASHELRTPLTMIYGFSELLTQPSVTERQRSEWASTIHAQSRRLAGLLDELLDVARIQSGRVSLRRERVDLQATVNEAAMLAGLPSERHAYLVDAPPEVPAALGDRDKVVQVLANLLTNAVKYSPGGGAITVRVRPDHGRERVVVGVADQGMGIAPKDRDRLFTTFWRIRRPETEGIPGTGLGLYIVRSLVEMMGGQVSLESELNKGSIFWFTLPLAGEDTPAPEPQAPALPRLG